MNITLPTVERDTDRQPVPLNRRHRRSEPRPAHRYLGQDTWCSTPTPSSASTSRRSSLRSTSTTTPYSVSELDGVSRLTRQRMDFLLLMNQRARTVIEVDGIQHYARQVEALTMQRPGTVWLADPGRYASMVAEDRQLTLQGYDVYRIGGHELRNHAAGEAMLTDFFTRLLSRHGHLQPR